MIWCKNDYHNKQMWCGCKIRLSRADYFLAWEEKNTNKTTKFNTTKINISTRSSEFKIVLVAMTSPEDFVVFQEQFETLK